MNSTENKNSQAKVVVGMSGGVDSSVTAALLKRQGYEVSGVFMKNWHSDDPQFRGICPWEEDLKDAKTVAARLDIPLEIWNFEKEYYDAVVKYFFSEYRNGRTPNPDVMCNKEVKFKAFLRRAMASGANYVATGHYARVMSGGNLSGTLRNKLNKLGIDAKQQSHYLLAGKDSNKDQSYFLWSIDKNSLPKILMPVGEYRKNEVRKMAKDFGLPTHDKKDSQGICFIGPIDVKKYLKTELSIKPGKVINEQGEVVGKHEGVWFYTEGQRSGIGTTGGGVPYYVTSKDIKKNILYVAPRRSPLLFAKKLIAGDFNWLVSPPPYRKSFDARIRYRHPAAAVSSGADGEFTFKTPQRAVTPGQSIVFYLDDLVLGGGVIERPVLY